MVHSYEMNRLHILSLLILTHMKKKKNIVTIIIESSPVYKQKIKSLDKGLSVVRLNLHSFRWVDSKVCSLYHWTPWVPNYSGENHH